MCVMKMKLFSFSLKILVLFAGLSCDFVSELVEGTDLVEAFM